jgi:hypothetical protein
MPAALLALALEARWFGFYYRDTGNDGDIGNQKGVWGETPQVYRGATKLGGLQLIAVSEHGTWHLICAF